MNIRRFAPAAVFAVLTGSSALADTLHVPDQYATIQSAIDAAVPGDTILIASGTYAPFAVRTDDLTVRGADDASNPIIAMSGIPFPVGVVIEADRVTVEGLSVDGTGAFLLTGFRVAGDDNTLRRNHVLFNPLAFVNLWGFEALSCNRTVYEENRVDNKAFCGFRASGCTDEIYVGNEVHDLHGSGFQANGCTNQTYVENSVSFASLGFDCYGGSGTSYVENVATDCLGGFSLQNASNASIRENTADGGGFRLINCTGSDLRENTAMSGYAGIWLIASHGNVLRENSVTGSAPGSGFVLEGGSDSNSLIENLSTDNAGFGYSVTALLSNTFLENEAENNAMGDANQSGIVD